MPLLSPLVGSTVARVKPDLALCPVRFECGGIEWQTRAFIRCAQLSRNAGYESVEMTDSEGYLINQFLVTHTNHRIA